MPVIARTHASLRFAGDDLDPDALTAALGKPPTGSMRKGEPRTLKGKVVCSADGEPLIAHTSTWQYAVGPRVPGDLDGQIRELFGALTDDSSVWRSLTQEYGADLFVGLFMQEENEGLVISADCLGMLAARGVSLSLDIYDPPGD